MFSGASLRLFLQASGCLLSQPVTWKSDDNTLQSSCLVA